jgi:hypothetical protein
MQLRLTIKHRDHLLRYLSLCVPCIVCCINYLYVCSVRHTNRCDHQNQSVISPSSSNMKGRGTVLPTAIQDRKMFMHLYIHASASNVICVFLSFNCKSSKQILAKMIIRVRLIVRL